MSSPAKPTTEPVVLSPSYVQVNPPESFDGPLRGNVTWHTLLSHPQTPTSDLCAGLASCPPRDGKLCDHRHAQCEIYYILEGRGTVKIGGKSYPVEKGSVVYIPGDEEHGVVNESDEELKWFYVFPTGSFSDVVYRFTHEA